MSGAMSGMMSGMMSTMGEMSGMLSGMMSQMGGMSGHDHDAMEAAVVKQMMDKAVESYKESDFAAEKEMMANAIAGVTKPAACSDADFEKAKEAVQEMFKPEIMKKAMEAGMMEEMMEGEHHDDHDGHDHGSGSGEHHDDHDG